MVLEVCPETSGGVWDYVAGLMAWGFWRVL